MILPTVIFTFGADGPCALETAGHMRLLYPGDPVEIWEDGKNPLSGTHKQALEQLGCRIRTTWHDRQGNLNGRENLEVQHKCLLSVMEEHGASHVVKLDSDTLVFRRKRLELAAAAGMQLAGGSFQSWGFSGTCYLAGKLLCEALWLAAREDKLPPGMPSRFNEDLAALAMVRHNGMPHSVWVSTLEKGFRAGWQYDRAKVPPEEYIRRFDVVNFGNRIFLQGGDCERREQVAMAMARFRRVFQLSRQEQASKPSA